MKSLRTPIGRVRGLGSAKEGVQHWWMQRLTALALVPLSLWFVYWAVALTGADYRDAITWIDRPRNTVLLVLLVAATFYHGQLGLQVVIEDYVHGKGRKLALLLAVKFLAILLAVGAIIGIVGVGYGDYR